MACAALNAAPGRRSSKALKPVVDQRPYVAVSPADVAELSLRSRPTRWTSA